ncbi:MAG TPA: hypothetical protein VNO21_06655 [Polyangiaceae bacterium]|nr:hypothetical protein [Polyangiaceae bacterium]
MDEALEAEINLWYTVIPADAPRPELTMWVARTACHAVIRNAFLERPDDVFTPEFADEVARLLTRCLRRR